jgi:hypothetical protein
MTGEETHLFFILKNLKKIVDIPTIKVIYGYNPPTYEKGK